MAGELLKKTLGQLILTKDRADAAWEYIMKNKHQLTQQDFINAMTQCDWVDRRILEHNHKYPKQKICLNPKSQSS